MRAALAAGDSGDLGGGDEPESLLDALEAAYEQGFDVANMSLGGESHGNQDVLGIAVNNLDRANMVVAVAAGNSGPGHYTVESPGNAERALTAGASTVPHFVGAPVTIGSDTFGGAVGDFATVETDLTAPLAAVMDGGTLSTACTAISDDLTGKIAAVSRGVCSFSTKIRNAQEAGALATAAAGSRCAASLGSTRRLRGSKPSTRQARSTVECV